jgi:hypothetical protein
MHSYNMRCSVLLGRRAWSYVTWMALFMVTTRNLTVFCACASYWTASPPPQTIIKFLTFILIVFILRPTCPSLVMAVVKTKIKTQCYVDFGLDKTNWKWLGIAVADASWRLLRWMYDFHSDRVSQLCRYLENSPLIVTGKFVLVDQIENTFLLKILMTVPCVCWWVCDTESGLSDCILFCQQSVRGKQFNRYAHVLNTVFEKWSANKQQLFII